MELDWQHQFKNQKDRILHLMQSNTLADCQFVVNDDSTSNQKTIPAHKLILSVASPVFERMFYGAIAEKDGPIVITDIPLDVFQILLKYIYSDCILIKDVDQAVQLYYAAKKYMLPQLMEKCTLYLNQNLNSSNACRIYEFADFYDETNLKQKCLKLIINRTRSVLADPSFCNIKMTTMMVILDQDKLMIKDELDLLNALAQLANAKGLLGDNGSKCDQNDAEMFNEALKKIRFLTLTQQQLAQALDICSKLINSNTLPPGFSCSRRRRTICQLQIGHFPPNTYTIHNSMHYRWYMCADCGNFHPESAHSLW